EVVDEGDERGLSAEALVERAARGRRWLGRHLGGCRFLLLVVVGDLRGRRFGRLLRPAAPQQDDTHKNTECPNHWICLTPLACREQVREWQHQQTAAKRDSRSACDVPHTPVSDPPHRGMTILPQARGAPHRTSANRPGAAFQDRRSARSSQAQPGGRLTPDSISSIMRYPFLE